MFEFEKPQGFHVYATSAALKFEQGHYKDQPVLVLEAAAKGGKEFDWQNRITLTFSERELPALLCCVLGMQTTLQARNHGPQKNKGLDLCLVPERKGLWYRPLSEEDPWLKFYTNAPRPRTPSERSYSDRRIRSRR